RDDEKSGQARSMFSEQPGEVALRNQGDASFKTARNQLSRAHRLKSLQNFFSNGEDAIPIGAAFLVERTSQFLRSRKQTHVHAFGCVRALRQVLPNFFRSENKRGRNQMQQSAGDAIDGGLCGAAAAIIRRERVQAVLENIEIER